jgi:hypothetical protein
MAYVGIDVHKKQRHMCLRRGMQPGGARLSLGLDRRRRME